MKASRRLAHPAQQTIQIPHPSPCLCGSSDPIHARQAFCHELPAQTPPPSAYLVFLPLPGFLIALSIPTLFCASGLCVSEGGELTEKALGLRTSSPVYKLRGVHQSRTPCRGFFSFVHSFVPVGAITSPLLCCCGDFCILVASVFVSH